MGLLPTVVVATAILILPGLAMTRAAGVRGHWSLVWAPAASVGLVATSAVIASVAGIPWGVLPPVGLTVLVAGAVLGIRVLLRSRGLIAAPSPSATVTSWRGSLRRDAPVLAGVLLAALLLSWRLAEGIGSPEAFSQTYDNNFHLNAVQWIADTGDASSLTIGTMTSAGGPASFYPAAWHGVVSLTQSITSASVPASANAVTIAIGAVAWPLGLLALAGVLVEIRRWAVVAAAACLAGFATFPYLLVDFGVLYPNFLGYALVPATLSVAAVLVRAAVPQVPAAGSAALLLVPVALGAGLAHPSAAMMVAALAIPLIVVVVVRCVSAGLGGRARSGSDSPRISPTPVRRIAAWGTAVGVTAIAVVGYPILWQAINPGFDPRFWKPYQTAAQAIGEAVMATGMQRPVAVVLAVLAVAGAAVIVRRRAVTVWFLGSVAVVGLLWIIVSGMQPNWLRDTITSVWYNDSNRIASALPLVTGALVVAGVLWLADVLRSLTLDRWGVVVSYAVSAVVLGLVVAGTQGSAVGVAVASMRERYAVQPDSVFVTSDELALIEELPEVVPDGSRIAVNPFTGGSLAYAISDVPTTAPHTMTTFTQDMRLINDGLQTAEPGSEVCAAVEREGVTHVLDFGRVEIHGGDNGFHGLTDVSDSDVLTLVDQVGDAKLWGVTGC
ncbi:hypothetical protein SERN_2678 [Serinibacter arcticus]|uniref:Uncharacterized protein n=2 Tax=Serinibacter arcticus TaxID=1655435 RepID=A0A4Z1E2Q0_9MICO|nr:hypothetical protein SERN_2678 [Serinibacter arcticus]